MHRRVALIPAVALAVAGALVAPTGPAQAGTWNGLDPRPVGWSATDSWSQRKAVLNYWTSQRMQAAEWLSVPRPRRTTQSGPTRGNPWAVRGASFTKQSKGGAAWSVRPTKATTSLQAVVPNSPGLRWTD